MAWFFENSQRWKVNRFDKSFTALELIKRGTCRIVSEIRDVRFKQRLLRKSSSHCIRFKIRSLSKSSSTRSAIPCICCVYKLPFKIKRLRGSNKKLNFSAGSISWGSINRPSEVRCRLNSSKVAEPRETVVTRGKYKGPSSCGWRINLFKRHYLISK